VRLILDEEAMIAEAILLRYEGKNDEEISEILNLSLTKLGVIGKKSRSLSKKKYHTIIDNELLGKHPDRMDKRNKRAIVLIEEGKNDTQISKILGISRTKLRKIREIEGLKPSSGGRKKINTDREWSDVVNLIREGYIIGEITKKTGLSTKRIYEFWNQERINGNILPEIKKGQARKQKYSDEELIELAYLNPGYGFKRFINYLKVSDNFVMNLFLEFKDFTENEEDLINILQDERLLEMVTERKYREITGKKYVPKGASKRGSFARRNNLNRETKLFLVPLPPQVFYWGNIDQK